MGKRSIPYHNILIEQLKDPEEASAYLNEVLEDNDPKLFLKALNNVVEAFGGIGQLAKKTNLNRANLYKILSEEGNPEYQTLFTIFNALGLSFQMKHKEAA